MNQLRLEATLLPAFCASAVACNRNFKVSLFWDLTCVLSGLNRGGILGVGNDGSNQLPFTLGLGNLLTSH